MAFAVGEEVNGEGSGLVGFVCASAQSKEATTTSAAVGYAVPSTYPSCYATSEPSPSDLPAMATGVGLPKENGYLRPKGLSPNGTACANQKVSTTSRKVRSRPNAACLGSSTEMEIAVAGYAQPATEVTAS